MVDRPPSIVSPVRAGSAARRAGHSRGDRDLTPPWPLLRAPPDPGARMFTWPRDRRLPVLGAYTALALAASALVVSGTAEGASGPGEEFFAPRLVAVDTPTRDDK